MHQISYPLTAQYLNTKNYIELDALYKKTSLTSFIAAGILFVLILLNIDDLYKILPEAYGGGFYIICLIGLAKVFDSVLGNIMWRGCTLRDVPWAFPVKVMDCIVYVSLIERRHAGGYGGGVG